MDLVVVSLTYKLLRLGSTTFLCILITHTYTRKQNDKEDCLRWGWKSTGSDGSCTRRQQTFSLGSLGWDWDWINSSSQRTYHQRLYLRLWFSWSSRRMANPSSCINIFIWYCFVYLLNSYRWNSLLLELKMVVIGGREFIQHFVDFIGKGSQLLWFGEIQKNKSLFVTS